MRGIRIRKLYGYIIPKELENLEGDFYHIDYDNDIFEMKKCNKEELKDKFYDNVIHEDFAVTERFVKNENNNPIFEIAESDMYALHDLISELNITDKDAVIRAIEDGLFDNKFEFEEVYKLDVQIGNTLQTYSFHETTEKFFDVGQNHESNKYNELFEKSEFIKGITGGKNEFSRRAVENEDNWYITIFDKIDGVEYSINWSKDRILGELRKEFPKEMEMIEKVNDNSIEQIEKPIEINLTVVKETNDLDNIELPDNQKDDDFSWITE